MKVCVAAICDFAQVRQGLLTVVSAGITRLYRSKYPSPLGVMVGLVIEIAPSEAQTPRRIRVRVEDADGARLAELSTGFQIDAPSSRRDPGELLMVPFAFDLRNVTLPTAGRYQIVIDLMVEGVEATMLGFRAGFADTPGGRRRQG